MSPDKVVALTELTSDSSLLKLKNTNHLELVLKKNANSKAGFVV